MAEGRLQKTEPGVFYRIIPGLFEQAAVDQACKLFRDLRPVALEVAEVQVFKGIACCGNKDISDEEEVLHLLFLSPESSPQ